MNEEPLLLMHSKRNVDEAYQQSSLYLKKNTTILEEIHNHYWALHYAWDVIPQDGTTLFSSSHTFPAIESESKFDTAIELALEGFYHESILVLKSSYELGLLSVFYNHDNSGPINIEPWASGQADTPFMRDIKKKLSLITAFNSFDKEFDLFKDLDGVYGALNDYSHTKGLRYSSRGIAKKSNVNHFDETAFIEWWRMACAVAKTIVLVHVIRYPLAITKLNLDLKFGIDIPLGYFLDDGHVDMVRKILPDDRLKFIEGLLAGDEFSQNVIKDIASMPDMTKTQLKEQSLGLNKSFVSHSQTGYEGWFDAHWSFYKNQDKKVQNEFLDEAKILKEWAIKNKCLKSHISMEGE